MKLLTYLFETDLQSLQRMATRLGMFRPENSKQRLVTRISQSLTNPIQLEVVVEEQPVLAQELLKFMLVRPGWVWQEQEIVGLFPSTTVQEIREMLHGLVQYGLLLPIKTSPEAERSYQLFEEVLPALGSCFGVESHNPFDQAEPPEQLHFLPRIWADDLLTLLAHLANHTVRVRKTQDLFKRHLDGVKDKLKWERFGSVYQKMADMEMPWIERLVEYLQQQLLIRLDEVSVQVNPGALKELSRLVNGSKPEFSDLSCLPGSEGLTATDYEIVYHLIEKARTEPEPGQWHSVAAMAEHLYPHNLFENWKQLRLRLHRVLFDLMTLNEIELGQSGSDWFWRVREFRGDQEISKPGMLHVQPNFEVIVSPELPLKDRCVLEEIADLVFVDQVFHYQINRDSVYRGFCRGWEISQQLEWYETRLVSRRALPQNIRQSFESWERSFTRVLLERPLLLVCESPSLVAELLQMPEIQPLCLGHLDDCRLILKSDAAEEVVAVLRSLDYFCRPTIGDGACLVTHRHEA